MQAIGLCYTNLGQTQKAFQFYVEAVKIRKQLHGNDHVDVAESLICIGFIHCNL